MIGLVVVVIVALIAVGGLAFLSARTHPVRTRSGASQSPDETIPTRASHAGGQSSSGDGSTGQHDLVGARPVPAETSFAAEKVVGTDVEDDERSRGRSLQGLSPRQIVALVLDHQRRLDATMDNYTMWRQKYLNAGCRLPRAIEEFGTTLGVLEDIERDLVQWQRATKDPHAHEAFRILDDNLGRALPPVRLMIEKARMLSR